MQEHKRTSFQEQLNYLETLGVGGLIKLCEEHKIHGARTMSHSCIMMRLLCALGFDEPYTADDGKHVVLSGGKRFLLPNVMRCVMVIFDGGFLPHLEYRRETTRGEAERIFKTGYWNPALAAAFPDIKPE